MATLTVDAEEFRHQLTNWLYRVWYGGDDVIVECNARPIAVLKPYEPVDPAPERPENDGEQVPKLAAQLEAAREAAGIAYEELAQQLQAEHLRTLRDKYLDFAAEFDHDLVLEPA